MRFGRWAAAAAAMVLGANAAQAATFVEYEAVGTGFIYQQYGSFFPVKTGDFFFDFVAEIDPNYSSNGGISYGTGSSYHYQSGEHDTSSVSINGSTISIAGEDLQEHYGPHYTGTIVLPAVNDFRLSDIPSYSIATGLVVYDIGTSSYGLIRYTGSITSIHQIGVVPAFIEPSARLLPEPATWAMMILGVGAVGATMRRKTAAAPMAVII